VKIIRGLPTRLPRAVTRGAVTLGVFDGVHRGHEAILRATLERARALKGSAVVITFDRHPLTVLAPDLAPRCIMTLPQRLERFAALGFDLAVVLPFTRSLARRPAADFVRTVLTRRLRAAAVVVGYDFHFGRGGRGDAALLSALGLRHGFSVTVVPPALDHGEPISSTRIRRLIRLGRFAGACRLLGRPPVLSGVRVHGRRLGRRLGFPTINFLPHNELLPPHGIYAARLRPRGAARLPAVAYLGARPTVERGGARPQLEVHCLGVVPRIPAGSVADIELIAYQRPDRKFPGLGPLQLQIARDAARARRILGLTQRRRRA
jgi:riboflavin kinase/FMN adenylyltransferase